MPFLKRVFGKNDAGAKSKKSAPAVTNGHSDPVKPQWVDAWTRTTIHPEEVSELIRGCTAELKARALDLPFLLLPFRPTSDSSASKAFVRNYFSPLSGANPLRGDALMQELKLTDPMILASVLKWCWSRLPGGVVTWDSYELFKVGEHDSRFARDAFSTFIPISVESDARTQIIFDFFDLMAAIAAHAKTNGLGGRKLSRYAGWWAFEYEDTGKGFEVGYRSWERAADATSHLFFAYLRSLSPESSKATKGFLTLPLSLQTLLQQTEYPPEPPTLLFTESTKVVMIVDTVSPTPFSLLRRAKNFEYRASDRDLQQFSRYEDPVQALTDECRRVLRSISSSNQSAVSKNTESTGLRSPSWSRFEDIGFGAPIDDAEGESGSEFGSFVSRSRPMGLSRSPNSQVNDLGRPTTPSWADFLSTGFADENGQKAPSPLLLPPDKVLPPIHTTSQRGHSSQSHRRNPQIEETLEPGELASITKLDLDDSFWWVWISSLAGEEPTTRKAVFGRCALIETVIPGGKWLVMEEQVKGAEAAQPAPGAYIAEKKGFFSFASRKNKVNRRKSAIKRQGYGQEPYQNPQTAPASKVTIGPDQQARIQAAAAALHQRNQEQDAVANAARRGRMDDAMSTKTSSVFTLQPVIMNEASPALKWASQYDKAARRAKYLGDNLAGKGASTEMLTLPENGFPTNRSAVSLASANEGRTSPQPPPKDVPRKAVQPAPVEKPNPVQIPAVVEPEMTPPQPEIAPEETKMLNEQAGQAAEVPLPAETPSNEPANDLVPISTRSEREAPVVKEKSTPVTPAPAPASEPARARLSPEHKKLKKKNQAGFKGIFSSRKAPAKDVTSPTSTAASSNTAVAAARAALEAKAAPVEPMPKTGRFGKNKASNRAAQVLPQSAMSPPEQASIPVVQEPTPKAEHFHEERPRTYRDEEYDQLSRVDTDEREDADREFSKFDQGPLTDQPAFVPEDSPEPPPYESSMPADEDQYPVHHAATTIDEAVPEEDEDEETSTPPSQRGMSPNYAQDRWAQIRKNAADRAARQSEEQSRHTDKTDDGETSGEETIESRVARIKARVAELTGNMEQARR